MPRLKKSSTSTTNIITILCSLLTVVRSQVNPVNVDKNQPCAGQSIGLPSDKKCLVPIEKTSTWVDALNTCADLGGTLYETPDAYIGSRPGLMKCLNAIPNSKYDNLWINAVGIWSPHFFWINGTWVNKIDFCTMDQPAPDQSVTPIFSNYLSVDYCVSSCHNNADRFIVLHNRKTYPECYCIRELPDKYKLQCPNADQSVDFSNKRAYYIVNSKEDSLISVANKDALTETQILCAKVDSKTVTERQIMSQTCFTENHFICCLGTADRCINTECSTEVCRFHMQNKCMLRVSIAYTWYAARAYCVKLGGDLWNMHHLNEMTQVNYYIENDKQYWIGATNFGWSFNGTNATVGNLLFQDEVRVRCGSMVKQTDSSSTTLWKWSDIGCAQERAYLCQFNKTNFSNEENTKEVICPWPMPELPLVTTTPNNNTGLPVTEGFVGGYAGEGFPIAAIIAAIIAGIILLTCMGLLFTWCSRRHMIAGRFKGVRERLAFIPYFADIPVIADYDAHAAMSSVSEHGSQVGLVKGEYHNAMSSSYGMSSSYAEQSGMFANSSKSMDRSQFGRSQNYLASGHSSAAEREFATSTMAANNQGSMTLQAQMSILDDAEVAAMRESFRRKPEVALVTDNVDMNFTVNHAVSQGHHMSGSSVEMGGTSADLGRSFSERTVEGIIMPVTEGGVTMNLPDRVVEEARLYSTLKSTYNV